MPELDPKHDFCMVAGPNGWATNTRYTADQFSEAVAEAERLASYSPGQQFYVLATVAVTKTDQKLTTIYL